MPQIRAAWPDVEIVIRADSGFCRNEIMTWCEDNTVEYILGQAKTSRLKNEIADELEEARLLSEETGQAARVFKDFNWRTLDSWSRSRRVVAKAEHLPKGSNPRFVVTSIAKEQMDARTLYEDLYCARGEMENRIKEQQMCLFADRTSTASFRGNQIRLTFSSVAYWLVQSLRRLGLAGTEFAKARCDTIRLKLLKIGARLKVSVRRITVSLSESYPYATIFAKVYKNLIALVPVCT